MANNYIPFPFDFAKEYKVYQGVYLERAFTITQPTADMLAGRDIVMQVRRNVGDGIVVLEFSTADNTIVISGLTLTIKMNADLMTMPPDDYVYDMNAYSTAEDNVKIMAGKFNIVPTVTR